MRRGVVEGNDVTTYYLRKRAPVPVPVPSTSGLRKVARRAIAVLVLEGRRTGGTPHQDGWTLDGVLRVQAVPVFELPTAPPPRNHVSLAPFSFDGS